jgi:hypothetical protein
MPNWTCCPGTSQRILQLTLQTSRERRFMRISRRLAVIGTCTFAGLGILAVPTSPVLAGEVPGQSLVFNAHAHPYGTSMVDWSESWWRWELSVPTAQNPGLDPTGANCAVNQSGPVWNLGPNFSSPSVVRSCTVPAGRALLINLSGTLADYPCPDPTFQPPPGESLQQFLTGVAASVTHMVNNLTLSIDGTRVPNLFSYQYTTTLFYFTGAPDLAQSIDPCITGSSQPAVSVAYFTVVKPLAPGTHTLVYTSNDTAGNFSSTTYTITVP